MRDQNSKKENPVLEAFQACSDALVRSIMKMRVQQQDVDDILQETYLRVVDANKRKAIRSPQDYMFVVSRNLVLRGLSRQSKEIVSEIDEALSDEEISPEMDLHHQRRFESFNTALRSLPDKHRQAILLRKYYGLTHKEIASKMKISVSSVEKYIAQGIRQCKQSLVSQGYEIGSQSNTPMTETQTTNGHAVKEQS